MTKRLKPFEHQTQAMHWVLSRHTSYIAYEAGLGKTAIAPMCINVAPGRTLIICPAFLKLNWLEELNMWLNDYKDIQILNSKTDSPRYDADIIICPDSLIGDHNFRQRFFIEYSQKFTYIFVDEAHRFKSFDAKRTQSLIGKKQVKVGRGKKAEYFRYEGFHTITQHMVFLSGTPMPNGRPIEIYPIAAKTCPQAVGKLPLTKFGQKFCNAHQTNWGWGYNGANNLDELNTLLTKEFMLIKKKRECLDMPDIMPPKLIYIDAPRDEEELGILTKLSLNKILASEMKQDENFAQTVTEALESSGSALGFIASLRLRLGIAKIPATIKVVKGLLEEHAKLVVFAWHKEVVKELVEELSEYSAVSITGETPMEKRHEIVKSFQNDFPHPRVLVANIQAAGVGITLHASSVAVFAEFSWVPSDNEQAFARIDRVGQTKDVQAYYIVKRNSLDHMVINSFINKAVNIEQTIKPV